MLERDRFVLHFLYSVVLLLSCLNPTVLHIPRIPSLWQPLGIPAQFFHWILLDFLMAFFVRNLNIHRVFMSILLAARIGPSLFIYFFYGMGFVVKFWTSTKCFLKKLSVWLTLIKVTVWVVNYQKGQCIYKGVYFILFFLIFFFMWVWFILKSTTSSYLNQFFLSKKIIFFSPILANNNLSLKIYCEIIVKILW